MTATSTRPTVGDTPMGWHTDEVPLASYMGYGEFKPSDVAYFQKFYDLFTEKGIFDKKVAVAELIYKG